MKRRRTAARFRLPYTERQAAALLTAACRAEVAARHRQFAQTPAYMRHIEDVARWLTAEDEPTFGLFLCGERGNGKTTLAKALQTLYHYLHSDEGHEARADRYPAYGFEMVTAKDLVLLAKANNNRTRENAEDVARYRRLREVEVLCIDELGEEPAESMSYGDYVYAATDMLSYRYAEQLCTIATSNMAAGDIRKRYDERIADRMREMMFIVNFEHEPSFRTL